MKFNVTRKIINGTFANGFEFRISTKSETDSFGDSWYFLLETNGHKIFTDSSEYKASGMFPIQFRLKVADDLRNLGISRDEALDIANMVGDF